MKTISPTTSDLVERLRKAAANSRLSRGDEDRMYEAADEIERLRGVRDDVNRDNERLVRELAKAADEIERLTGLFDKWHTIAAEQREEIKQLKEEKGSGCKP